MNGDENFKVCGKLHKVEMWDTKKSYWNVFKFIVCFFLSYL